MLVGLISDTHDNMARTRAALGRFADAGVEAVLHMGDLVSPGMVDLFGDVPTWIAQGNVDRDPAAIEAACRTVAGDAGAGAEVRYADRHDVRLGGARIGVLHGDDRTRLDSMVASGAFDLVCHGHTHAFRDERVGGGGGGHADTGADTGTDTNTAGTGTRIVNPGAVHRTSEPSVCLYDPAADALERLLL